MMVERQKKPLTRCCVLTAYPPAVIERLSDNEAAIISGKPCLLVGWDDNFLTIRSDNGADIMIPNRLVNLVLIEGIQSPRTAGKNCLLES